MRAGSTERASLLVRVPGSALLCLLKRKTLALLAEPARGGTDDGVVVGPDARPIGLHGLVRLDRAIVLTPQAIGGPAGRHHQHRPVYQREIHVAGREATGRLAER